jgi:hypothetical protein
LVIIPPCKTYIDGKEDVIHAFRNGQIVKKAATGDALEDIYDVELLKKG